MNVEVKRIGADEVLRLCQGMFDLSPTEINTIHSFGGQSTIILAYWFGAELIAIAGFIPTAALTDTAYIWMQSALAAEHHKLMVGRVGILTLREVRKRYPRIVGHCMVGSRSVDWLKSLGAKFFDPKGNLTSFLIGDTHG